MVNLEIEIERKEYIQKLQDVCDTVLEGAVVTMPRFPIVRVTYKNHTPEWVMPTILGVQGQQKPFAQLLREYPWSVRGLFGDLRHG